MIAQFSVTNFRSILDRQTLSFLTTSERANRDLYAVEVRPGVFVNKLALFFGSNASGKTNMLKALESLFLLMTEPSASKQSPILQYVPFALNDAQPTVMEVDFYVNGIKYHYEVEYNATAILREELWYSPESRLARFYVRHFISDSVQPSIDFGNSLKLTSKTKRAILEATFNNSTVLSSVARISLDENARLLLDLYEWVAKYVHTVSNDERVRSTAAEFGKINSDKRLKQFYVQMLAKADFNITNFHLVDNSDNLTAAQLAKLLEDKNVSEEQRINLLNKVVFTNHSAKGDFDVELDLQSQGTLRFIDLLNTLFKMIEGNHIFFLDELGNRMHYDLLLYYITIFLYNSDASQLFFTTQSILLLDEDFIRRDIVYLAEKDTESASTTYARVSDMGLHKNLSLYNAYRIGRLGSKPNVASPYISI